ncbi:MAG: undecaprenyl-diphosphate phosphatase [Woeseiaceae bacterium]|nr:undecaprenyl-diphosphate phosphatase [Woeseiaceae bacterium]
MSWLQTIVLAIVQGLTEFLPISSSGHLVLVPAIFGWTDQGLIFDVAVHLGSLAAVCVYFRKDLAGLVAGGVRLLAGSGESPESRMALYIVIGTIPAAITGLLFAGWIEANLRNPVVIVFTLSGYGVLMALADRLGRQQRIFATARLKDAIIIGIAQALALVPGTSRSGVTISAAMILGFQRQDAARFSFLLSAPVIMLAAAFELSMLFVEETQFAWAQLAIGVSISAVVAYFSIDFFMRFVNVIGLLPFAIYRLVLAGVVLYALV